MPINNLPVIGGHYTSQWREKDGWET